MILYTGYGDRALLADAIEAGVAGLIDKESPLEDLVRAVRVVAGGETYIDSGLGALLLAARSGRRADSLTARERDVLRLLADGCSNDAIAERALDLAADRPHARPEGDGAARRDDAHAGRRDRAARGADQLVPAGRPLGGS